MHLWRLIESRAVTFFGTGAAFYHACLKAEITPRELDLSSLRTVTSTGSPLSTDGYRWLSNSVGRDLWINSTSGGTDICAAFTGGLPTLPVYEGEMQCRVLGAAVESYSESGQSLISEVGELVCTRPLPSMPLYFWGDQHNRRYIESYFERFRDDKGQPVWAHGDWLSLIPRPEAVGAVIYGRSDATINRHGVRMGTSELYRAVESFVEISDSMVVDLEYLGRESYMALFIVLRSGANLTPELDARLKQSIKTALSPRHVPNEILSVPDIPKTITGKKLEVPIKKLLLGQPLDKVVNRDALANPASLDWYVQFAHIRSNAG
jgi:acetoacetyl-CoA synthetase